MTLSVEMTPPPFDPELGAALPAVAAMIPAALTADLIPALRAGGPLGRPTDDELRRDGSRSATKTWPPSCQSMMFHPWSESWYGSTTVQPARSSGSRYSSAALCHVHRDPQDVAVKGPRILVVAMPQLW
jgi:hypothetical protein